MDKSLYTFNTAALGFLLPTPFFKTYKNIQRLPPNQSIGSLSDSLLPLVGQKLSGLTPFLKGNKKELVPTLGSPGEQQAIAPSLETDACYCSLLCSGNCCCVPLPWKVEPTQTEERLDFGRVCPLPWRGQDRTPFTQNLMWQEFSESAKLWAELELVGNRSYLFLFIPLNSAQHFPSCRSTPLKGTKVFWGQVLSRGRRKAGGQNSPWGDHSLATTHK